MANTKVTQHVIANNAITADQLASSAVTDAKLHSTLDLSGKTLTLPATAIPSASTATTQAASDNSTKLATTAYVTTAIGNLVDSAPTALDTLNELAAALGDDASFSTTITNSLATKAPINNPTFTGSISHASDLTLDVGGDISLDADGGDIIFKDAGSSIGRFKNNSGNFVIKSEGSDDDLKFLGNDGGSQITALTLDMSEAGFATFNSGGSFGGTGALKIPVGTTGQRPTAATGQIRWNSTDGAIEVYNGTAWTAVGTGSSNKVLDTFTGDGSTTTFTLSVTPANEDAIMVFIDGAYQEKSDYVLTNNSLVLDTAPLSAEKIAVHITTAAVHDGTSAVNNQFTATAGQTAFTLTQDPSSENNTQVYINGVYQQKTDYTVVGTTLTFDTGLTVGDVVEVNMFTVATLGNTDTVTEGVSNLYHTTARARGAISVSGNALSYNSSTGVITANFEESPTFTGTISSGPITVSTASMNSVTIGEDSTYGGYGVIGFSGTGNGHNRIFARDDSADGLFLASATGRGVFIRTDGSGSDTFGFTSGGDFQVASSTIISSTGAITSGAITSSGNLHAGDGTNISMDSSANGQLEVDGNGYQGAIALDGSAMHIYHNSSSRDLVLGTNETARLTIGGTGTFTFHSNNLQSIGTISSGAIVTTSNTATQFKNATDSDIQHKFETSSSSDYALTRLIGSDGIDNKFIIGYGPTHPSTPNMIALKATHASGSVGFFTGASSTSALTLDSSQDATFAGSVTIQDGSTDFNITGDSNNNTYFISNGEIRIRPLGTTTNKFVIGSNGNLTTAGSAYIGGASGDWIDANDELVVHGRGCFKGFGYNPLAIGRYNSAASAGEAGSVLSFLYGGAGVGSISVTTNSTQYNTTSDVRLKDNIKTIVDGSSKIMAMNPVSHTWKANPTEDAVHGFIAQEMKDIVPESVTGEPEGEEMMQMDYGRITPVIVAGLQDALKEIEELKNRIKVLENK